MNVKLGPTHMTGKGGVRGRGVHVEKKPAPGTAQPVADRPTSVDVTDVASTIVDKGSTPQHQANEEAAHLAPATHGGKRLSTSPQMARFGDTVGSQGTSKGTSKTTSTTTSTTSGTSDAKAKELSRNERLAARARPVITTDALNQAAHEVLVPLMGLIDDTPDPRRFNEVTWKAFQQAAPLDLDGLEALAAGLTSRPPSLPDRVPDALVAALTAPGVDRETVALLLRARALTSSVVEAELPSLSRDEVHALSGTVHDEGYFKEQAVRIASPTALLCGSADGVELLDARRLALLPPAVRARFSVETRIANAGTEAAMPRLTMKDLAESGTDAALSFLTLSGKNVDAAWPELGGVSPRAFLAKRTGESADARAARLASKQVLNPFARSFVALEDDARALGARGGAQVTERQLAFLRKKQEPALAPALLLVCTPALFDGTGGTTMAPERTMAALLQVCWRVGNPHLSFKDPLVSQGMNQLARTHGEQLAKDAHLGKVVIHAEKTRALSGLRDDTYDARLHALLTDRGIPVKSDYVAQALGRLVRDVGADSEPLQTALAALDLKGPEHDVTATLHALRHEPSMFPVTVTRGAPVELGGVKLSFAAGTGPLLPEVVGATTVAYRATLQGPMGDLAAGESVLVRVPKGSRLAQGPKGELRIVRLDERRLAETSARAADFEVMERRVRVTRRTRVDVDGVAIVLEKRGARASAAEQLTRGAQVSKHDVDALADQYLRGLCDVDATTRPFGVFYELGPDNYLMDSRGIVGSYVDVAMMFRTERERDAFGFFQGGYSSAANWIVGSNVPLSPGEVQGIWRDQTLGGAQRARRDLFAAALTARLDPRHPAYLGVAPEVRDRVIDSLRRDARALGLDAGTSTAYDHMATVVVGKGGKPAAEATSRANVARLRSALGTLAPAEQKLLAKIEAMPLRFSHRLTTEKLATVLDHGAIGTLASLKDRPSVQSATPPSEMKLFGAEQYVFAFVGFWTPPHKFGDIVMHLKDEAWQQRSWACTKSGYEHFMIAEQKTRTHKLTEAELTYDRYDAPSPALVEGARRSMKDDLYLPHDYAAAGALEVVALLRRRGIDANELLALGPEALRGRLVSVMDDEYVRGRRKTGFLEAKLKDDVALGDVALVEIPDTARNKSLIDRLESQGVAVRRLPEDP